MALAALNTEKSDVRGRSGFDWSATLLRLRGSTALLVMAYMTNGLAELGENFTKMRELLNLIRECELPFVCMGDWNMTPEEIQETELMGPTCAVIKTPQGAEFTCSSENRLMDCALVDRRLESVVKVKPFWAVPWKSHFALQKSVFSEHPARIR